jgi:hypothetical protein
MRALVFLVLAVFPSVAWAQTPKGLRIEVGRSDNHEGDDRSATAAVRGFFAVDERGLISLEGGGLIGNPFLGADGGVDVRVPLPSRLSLLGRGGLGLMFEEEFNGLLWRYGGGIEVLLPTRNRIAITYQRGGHDDRDIGPHLLMVGFEFRLGGK